MYIRMGMSTLSSYSIQHENQHLLAAFNSVSFHSSIIPPGLIADMASRDENLSFSPQEEPVAAVAPPPRGKGKGTISAIIQILANAGSGPAPDPASDPASDPEPDPASDPEPDPASDPAREITPAELVDGPASEEVPASNPRQEFTIQNWKEQPDPLQYSPYTPPYTKKDYSENIKEDDKCKEAQTEAEYRIELLKINQTEAKGVFEAKFKTERAQQELQHAKQMAMLHLEIRQKYPSAKVDTAVVVVAKATAFPAHSIQSINRYDSGRQVAKQCFAIGGLASSAPAGGDSPVHVQKKFKRPSAIQGSPGEVLHALAVITDSVAPVADTVVRTDGMSDVEFRKLTSNAARRLRTKLDRLNGIPPKPRKPKVVPTTADEPK